MLDISYFPITIIFIYVPIRPTFINSTTILYVIFKIFRFAHFQEYQHEQNLLSTIVKTQELSDYEYSNYNRRMFIWTKKKFPLYIPCILYKNRKNGLKKKNYIEVQFFGYASLTLSNRLITLIICLFCFVNEISTYTN